VSNLRRDRKEAERARSLRRRPDVPLRAVAAWIAVSVSLCALSATVAGDESAPASLSVASDARPITTLSGPELDSPQGPVGTLRFSLPAETPSGRRNSSQGSLDSVGTVLRWKTRQSDAASAATGFSVRQSASDWQNRGQKNGVAIRPAGHQDAPAPFRDPFDDQAAASAATIKLRAPVGPVSQSGTDVIQTASADDYAPAPPAPWTQKSDSPQQKSTVRPGNGFLPPARVRPFAEQKPSRVEELPPLQPAEPMLPDFLRLPNDTPAAPMTPSKAGEKPAPAKQQPAPAEKAAPVMPPAPSIGPAYQLPDVRQGTASGACERTYNGRDCCEEDRKCQTARQALRDNAITKISLDITAPFKPDAASLEEERQAREDQLRQIPARQWRDRNGQLVASGRLTEIANQKVQITGADGKSAAVPLVNLSDDDLCFLAAWWGVPTECSLGGDSFNPRNWEQVTFTWKASALCHKPLYFEEVGVERYGHAMCPLLEPVHSGAHFFLNIAFLPYKAGINPPHECQYALGYYRPGNCAPWLVPPVPVSLRGALLQGAAAVGLVYLFP